MKRTVLALLVGILISGLMTSLSTAQNSTTVQNSVSPPEPSLGSYARAVKKDKKPQPTAAKKFDNDNLPKDDKISVVGNGATASVDPSSAPLSDAPAAAAGATEKMAVQPGQSQEQRQAVYDQWQQRIGTQQAEVDLLQRELDVDQREYRLRSAAFYADAGDRLRNEAAWDKEDADYKQKLADKQKALVEAKQKVADMQEEARKSGVPSSARENAQPEPQQ
jgi:hypothetical protein